jgi:uncharacterized protein YjbJ (UPF0337 family)
MATVVTAQCPIRGITMNKEQVKGRAEEAKGKIKEVAGHVVGNKDLEFEGNVEKNTGKLKAGLGDLKEDIKKGL